MPRKCEVCGVDTHKTCIGCSRTAYCSTKCQKQQWFSHILRCENPGREVTTADRLVALIMTKDFTLDTPTMRDYGFSKAKSMAEGNSAVAVYSEIIRIYGVRAPALHKWRIEGRLYEEMVRTYREAGKEESNSSTFRWLLEHAYMFSSETSQNTSLLYDLGFNLERRAWIHIGGSPTDSHDDIMFAQRLWSADRKQCFKFCMHALSNGGPSVEATSLWTQFGFCVFDDFECRPLQRLYATLIRNCTFNELCDAYSSSSLISLIDRKKLKTARRKLPPDFETVLSASPHKIPSVWYLKSFALYDEARVPTTDVLIPFGFCNCENNAAMTRLRLFYGRLFKQYKVSPTQLQDAADHDQLYEYVMKIPNLNISKVEKQYLRDVLQTQNRLRALANRMASSNPTL
ncbi:hypothetical protein SISNIDRAFT_468729 [Sistotremastrum niveocremeum HHB9708]|uniref:MYND-type domain-containing protein n=1 Tax=Sistotremastrum niveocremeum HHB9708 TaxID=1314777 RepID=A0A164QXG3_9AGAM|nr:hypothetical protein SISNIDRAFT_468729 [Sistotremastrum niveocremeum HHB9708]